jgi:hypothetical protein
MLNKRNTIASGNLVAANLVVHVCFQYNLPRVFVSPISATFSSPFNFFVITMDLCRSLLGLSFLDRNTALVLFLTFDLRRYFK